MFKILIFIFSLFQKYLQHLYTKPLMIFGADVNHAAPINNETVESIAAVSLFKN